MEQGILRYNRAMMAMLIALSGPTGSGKTTLARAFATHLDVTVVEEILPEDELRSFDRDPQSYCCRLERSIILGRVKPPPMGPALTTVFDRTVAEDIEIFVQMHHERGLLSHGDVAELTRLAREVQRVVGFPDRYVFVTAPTALLAERIAAIGAPQAIQASLERQVVLYKGWKHRLRSPILDLDRSRIDKSRVPEIVDWILSTTSSIINEGERIDGPYGIAWTFSQYE